MKTVRSAFTISYEIHDSWTELLSGTRYLLDVLTEQNPGKIPRVNLRRLVVVTSYQMVEVMFFTQLIARVHSESADLERALNFDLKRNISFESAREKWPEIVMKEKLPLGQEPLQSMIQLGRLRNAAIHHSASSPDKEIGEGALFTSIQASEVVYEFFNDKRWKDSQYLGFCERYAAKSTTLVASLLQST